MVALGTFLLVLFLPRVCQVLLGKCRVRDPHPPLHKYHQPGALHIGGVASQAFVVSDSVAFNEEPPPASPELLV